ncbi:hypothetical protein FB451DRAFT_1365904 [Mycena latifolia]|nr:hypothetical protein FB451DRAFT_1365904 [Mycena latifolia]
MSLRVWYDPGACGRADAGEDQCEIDTAIELEAGADAEFVPRPATRWWSEISEAFEGGERGEALEELESVWRCVRNAARKKSFGQTIEFASKVAAEVNANISPKFRPEVGGWEREGRVRWSWRLAILASSSSDKEATMDESCSGAAGRGAAALRSLDGLDGHKRRRERAEGAFARAAHSNSSCESEAGGAGVEGYLDASPLPADGQSARRVKGEKANPATGPPPPHAPRPGDAPCGAGGRNGEKVEKGRRIMKREV